MPFVKHFCLHVNSALKNVSEKSNWLFHVVELTFYLAGLQLEEGVYCSSRSFTHHGQRFLEDDLGEECADSGHADTL